MKANLIRHSVSPFNVQIMTWEIEMPRFVWSEMQTHGRLGKNASSSRAIPVGRLTQDILDNTAMPVFWGSKKRGMQAGEEIDTPVTDPITGEVLSREEAWKRAASYGVAWARAFDEAGYHKQLANRLCENLGHIRAVITATEVDNFFDLRCHPDAQPEIQKIARMMRSSMKASVPDKLEIGEWHLPYISQDDVKRLVNIAVTAPSMKGKSISEITETARGLARLVSAARCARVSYKTFHGNVSRLDEDLELCKKLALTVPGHWSPFQHQGTPDTLKDGKWEHPEMFGNFVGMMRSRELFEADMNGMKKLTEIV